MRNNIYVVGSFMTKETSYGLEVKEVGKCYWFETLQEAEKYLTNAGQETPEGYYFDDPFEHRWGWAVIEGVPWGPWPMVVAKSWWRAIYADGRLQRAERLEESPVGDRQISSFG